MAGEEQEKRFEEALRRNLRASAGVPVSGQSGLCPDGEILAAYHERTLSVAEMSRCKAHIANCARCQQILARVEETAAVAVHLVADETHERDPVVAAAGVAGRRSAARTEISGARRGWWWLWAAPVGAIAAGLLVWVAVRQREDLRTVQMAKNEPASVSAPAPASAPVPRAELGSRDEVLTETAPVSAPKGTKTQPIAPAEQSRHQGLPARKVPEPSASGDAKFGREAQDAFAPQIPAAAPSASRISREDKETAQAAKAARGVVADAIAPQAPAVAPRPRDREENKKPEQSEPAAPAAVSATAESVEVTAADAAPRAAGTEKTDKANTVALAGLPQKQKAQLMKRASAMKDVNTPAMVLANSISPTVIAVADSKVSWRVGAAGLIERSDDSQATWTAQSSGVTSDLVTGSAVSEQVCWVVGKRGTILRTVDAGAHWMKVESPVVGDFTSVGAVDQQQATVSTADQSYQTSDGGSSWKKVGSP